MNIRKACGASDAGEEGGQHDGVEAIVHYAAKLKEELCQPGYQFTGQEDN